MYVGRTKRGGPTTGRAKQGVQTKVGEHMEHPGANEPPPRPPRQNLAVNIIHHLTARISLLSPHPQA